MGFDTQDLLKAAGVTENTLLPALSEGDGTISNIQTTSTTFTGSSSFVNIPFVPSDLQLGDTPGVLASFDVAPGNGETVDIRVQNLTDDETITELTGITGSLTSTTLGPEEFNPTTTSSRVVLRAQVRTNPGTNTTILSQGVLVVGSLL